MDDEKPTLTLIMMYTGESLLQLSSRMEGKMMKTQEYNKEKANIANRKSRQWTELPKLHTGEAYTF